MRKRKLPTGVTQRGDKLRAFVRVHAGPGGLKTATFELTTTDEKLIAWRERQVGLFRGAATGSFAADIDTYLEKPEVAAQKYIGQIKRMLALWLVELGGDRPRESITRDELETVIQKWLKRYAEPTVYHRRSALLGLYTVLDGDGAANPVKATTCPKSWIPADHSIPFATLTAIVDAMPAWRYPKKGIRQPSVAKLGAAVIVAVGLRPVDLERVRRPDVDWTAETFRWPASEKGQGVAAHRTELSAEGLAAFRAFDAADAYRRFNGEAASHSFKRAARKVCGADTLIHLYGLRHSVGADGYRETKDLATVGRLLGHAPGSRATAQYAQGANADVDHAALTAISAARARALVPIAGEKLPEKLPTKAKPSRRRHLRRAS